MNGNMNLGKRVTVLEKDGGADIKKEISDLQNAVSDVQTSVSTVQEEISNLENKVNRGQVYSTEETVCGTWIDGKTLYEKTFIGNISGNRDWLVLGTTSNLNIDKICHEKANWLSTDGYWYEGNKVDNSYAFLYRCGKENIQYLTTGMNITSITVTIQYTKTTDSPTQ